MPPNLINEIAPFLSKTTAIMTAVIILVIIGAWLVKTEKAINRATVEKMLKTIKSIIKWLIMLEFFLAGVELIIQGFKYV